MQQARNRRRIPLFSVGLLLTLTVGVGALGLIELPAFGIHPIAVDDPVNVFQVKYSGFANTGFSIRSTDDALLRLSGESEFDPTLGLQPGQTVQEGFVLLDGTLSLNVAGLKEDGTRGRMLTTYRLNIPRSSLRPENIARSLVRQGVVGDITRGRSRARSMQLDDARVMRLVRGGDGSERWMRSVRVLGTPDRLQFRPRREPTGVLGHFGTARPAAGDPFVWAVMDRNSRYAVGLTVDRDNDGVPNSRDNCIGSANSNQNDADADSAGDACDGDDDNDTIADAGDNCPLITNADQRDVDGDGAGDACDLDDDNDAVADSTDQCLATAAGQTVDGKGCSIADLCPCESDWRNHGAYSRCVARTSEWFSTAGLITAAQKDAIVSAGARSVCGC